MVYLKEWEDFEIAAENMFMQHPGQCRFSLKYQHSKGLIQLKFTDNVQVVFYIAIQKQIATIELIGNCNSFVYFAVPSV